MRIDPSHKVRSTDSPLFGIICDACKATDMDAYNERKLALPCARVPLPETRSGDVRARVKEALWQAYYHNAFRNVDGIDGTDSPHLEQLTAAILRRFEHLNLRVVDTEPCGECGTAKHEHERQDHSYTAPLDPDTMHSEGPVAPLDHDTMHSEGPVS